MLTFAVGTTRTPKVNGIKSGLEECAIHYEALRGESNFICQKTESGVSDMPLSIEEVMLGAENRALNLKESGVTADYYVGIEGGTTRIGKKAYLFGAVYVLNRSGEGHFGVSPMIEVPSAVDFQLYQEGKELGPVMGELSGRVDIRSENGSMGAWSEDMFTREDEFSVAVKAAMAPFFNKYYRL
jgi:inosine/xanthosine triphosphatase